MTQLAGSRVLTDEAGRALQVNIHPDCVIVLIHRGAAFWINYSRNKAKSSGRFVHSRSLRAAFKRINHSPERCRLTRGPPSTGHYRYCCAIVRPLKYAWTQLDELQNIQYKVTDTVSGRDQ